MGYLGGSGTEVGTDHAGQWWGVINEDEFMGQLNHTNDGNAHGNESMDAYFTLTSEGTITRYAGDGSVINSGSFEFDTSGANEQTSPKILRLTHNLPKVYPRCTQGVAKVKRLTLP